VKKQIIPRNAVVLERKTAQRTPETVGVPIIVAKLDRLTRRTFRAPGADAGRNVGDAPQCPDRSVMRYRDLVGENRGAIHRNFLTGWPSQKSGVFDRAKAVMTTRPLRSVTDVGQIDFNGRGLTQIRVNYLSTMVE
jgi:hypothetical protein